MSNKSKVKSNACLLERRRKKSLSTSRVHASSSLLGKFEKFAERKKRSHYSRTESKPEEQEQAENNAASSDAKFASNLPKDAAIHFGAFYGVQANDSAKPRPGRVTNSSATTATSYKPTPRLEFTRQMVQKLERTAGTEEYARQVSTLLEETVEPPHFKLHSLPAEISIPEGRFSHTGFPLWYKDPCKIPRESSEKKSWDEVDEYDEDEEERRSSSPNLSATGSSNVTEAKDTDSKESN